MALFYQFFKYPIPFATQEGLQVVTGVGVGLSLSTPILILQAAMPLKEMAAATSAWQLTRALGGSIGTYTAQITAPHHTTLRCHIVIFHVHIRDMSSPSRPLSL